MILNGILLVIFLVIAYVLGGQGFFSSFLHMVCVIAAGAIAFACWEPAVYFLAPKISNATFGDMLWGFLLIAIFTLSLLILRIITEKVCPANIHFSTTTNTLGGWACGFVSALISTGIVVIGTQMIPGPADKNAFGGYQGWALSSQGGQGGAVIRQTKLWIPADTLTARFYSMASTTSMPVGSDNALSTWHPNLDRQASLLRLSLDSGKSRQIAKPGDATVTRIIKLGFDTPEAKAAEIRTLSGAADPDTGSAPTDGDILIVQTSVKSSAFDSTGELRLGKGQVWLVVETYAGSGIYKSVYPHAFYQRFLTDAATEHRFPFADADTWAVSIGGASETKFGFEFLVPPNAVPHHLSIRLARADLPAVDAATLTRKQMDAMAAKGNW